MIKGITVFLLCAVLSIAPFAALANQPQSFFEFTSESISGQPISLTKFSGKLLLVVNTASRCGFTYQLSDLQRLHELYAERGFSVFGFPSNDFGGQEPGSNEEIRGFCSGQHNVAFPLFSKGRVKGSEKQELFRFLTESGPQETRGEIRWNFEKFLVNPQGKVIARFGSSIEPFDTQLVKRIERELPDK